MGLFRIRLILLFGIGLLVVELFLYLFCMDTHFFLKFWLLGLIFSVCFCGLDWVCCWWYDKCILWIQPWYFFHSCCLLLIQLSWFSLLIFLLRLHEILCCSNVLYVACLLLFSSFCASFIFLFNYQIAYQENNIGKGKRGEQKGKKGEKNLKWKTNC